MESFSIVEGILPKYKCKDQRNKSKFVAVRKLLDGQKVPEDDRAGVLIHYKRFLDDCAISAVENNVLY